MAKYNRISPYFGISILFLDRLDFSESASLTIFLIGDIVNFTASVIGEWMLLLLLLFSFF